MRTITTLTGIIRSIIYKRLSDAVSDGARLKYTVIRDSRLTLNRKKIDRKENARPDRNKEIE